MAVPNAIAFAGVSWYRDPTSDIVMLMKHSLPIPRNEPASRSRIHLLAVAVLILSLTTEIVAALTPSTNLADIYAQYGFDPAGPDSGLVVQINDVHFNADPDDPLYTMDFDPVLVEMIAAINPAVLFINGDLISSASATIGNPGDRALATLELEQAKAKIEEHFAAIPKICIVLGNHDSEIEDPEGAALFNSVYPGVPTYTNITVGGVPIIGLPGHNAGFLDSATKTWFAAQREVLDTNRQVLLMTHIPCLPVPPADGREQGIDIYRWINGWGAPVLLTAGHSHFRDYRRFRNGNSFVTKVETQTCTRKMSRQTGNPFWAGEAGFTTFVLQEGEIKGWFMGILTNRTYYPYRSLDLPIQPDVLAEPYEFVDGVLARFDEGYYDRSRFSVTAGNGAYHTRYSWFFNPGPLVPSWFMAELPAVPGATRLFFLAAPGQSQLHFYLGPSSTNLTEYTPSVAQPGNVIQIALPEALHGTGFWIKVTATSMAAVGGFALGADDSRNMTDFQKWAGKQPSQWALALALSRTNSYAPTTPVLAVNTNGFGFAISWAANASVVVEASTDLVNPAWFPVSTNELKQGVSYFNDPHWTNFPTRYYRLRWPSWPFNSSAR